MSDLRTRYLGMELPHPFMPGASPLVDDLDTVRRLEDAGAAAIVMHSLFEEKLIGEQLATHHYMDDTAESFAEARTFLPEPHDFALGPEEYLEEVRRVKESVSVPVIASLNGTTPGGWLRYAQLLEETGADALELNVYRLATDIVTTGEEIERQTLEIAKTIVDEVSIPVAVKLSPFYTSLPHFARRLDDVGVRGLVVFNRFYQADIDIDTLETIPELHLSDSSELLLRMRWLAIFSGHVRASLALSGGVHSAVDAIKGLMSGAHVIQMVSALLRNGVDHLRKIREETVHWMDEHEYESMEQMRGSMSLRQCPDPQHFVRANYMRVLHRWKPFADG
jgi:dihydroorotate dehydrogenase (fumarate)